MVRFEFPPTFVESVLWAARGDGLEEGEDDRSALERELVEEVGLRDPTVGPLIWTRTHLVPMSTGHDGQSERFYLRETKPLEPRPALSEEQLLAEFVTGLRWWTLEELAAADTVFAQRALPTLLEALLADGPPSQPIDVGI